MEQLERCPTCGGYGWMLSPEREGEPCPDCQNPLIIGGTGFKNGALPPELQRQLEQQEAE